jgi:hypothetical protein
MPLLVFALAGHVQAGGLVSLGALAVLYGPGLPYRLRAVRVLGVGAVLVLAMAAGTVASGDRTGTVAVIALVAGVGVLVSRWRSVAPPGALMPVLVCATATQIPLGSAALGPRVALVSLGVAVAWLVVMAGAPFRGWRATEPQGRAAPSGSPAPPWPQILRAVARGAVGTGTAVLVGLMLGVPRPDWAAVACAAVLTFDATRRTVFRAGHRAVGTAAGIGVAGAVLAVVPGVLPLVVLVLALQFAVELVVVRNYTLAVVLITPLALLQGTLATGQLGGPVLGLLAGRLVETAIGCAVALAAQAVLPPPGERPATTAFRLARGRRAPVLG